jgi:hypothetical protein
MDRSAESARKICERTVAAGGKSAFAPPVPEPPAGVFDVVVGEVRRQRRDLHMFPFPVEMPTAIPDTHLGPPVRQKLTFTSLPSAPEGPFLQSTYGLALGHWCLSLFSFE